MARKRVWCFFGGVIPQCTLWRQIELFVIWDYFFPFYPSNNLKKQNFEKMKKIPIDIIILHMCTVNEDDIMYDSWDMKHDRQNFLWFWAIFCLLTPLTAQKIKILKNWKKHLVISSFYNSVPKIMIISYTAHEIWSMTHVIIFHLGPFFAPLTARKIKIKKKWNELLEISSFYTSVP